MKKPFISIIIITIFALVICLPWAFYFGGFDDNASGTGEVRDLKEMPEEFTNGFFSDVEDYINDHSPMRLSLISLGKKITNGFSEYYQEKLTPVVRLILGEKVTPYVPDPTPSGTIDMGDLFGTPTPSPTPSDPDATEDPNQPVACQHEYETIKRQAASVMHDGYALKRCYLCGEYTIQNVVMRTSVDGFYDNWPTLTYSGAGYKGAHNWYFYAGDDSIGYVQGDNVLSEAEMKTWKDTFEELQKICDKKGVNLVILACPNKAQVYPEYLPSGIDKSKTDAEKREMKIVEYIKANSTVTYLYPIQKLKSAKILYETYLQQDTHWNTIGGFVGAMEVLSAIGYETIGIQNLEVTEYETSGGDLVSLGVGSSSTYTGYSTSYKPEVTLTYSYYSNSVSGGSVSGELKTIVSDLDTSHNAVIIGDSYRHAIFEYIAKNFKETIVGHRGDFYTVSTYMGDSVVNKAVIQDGVKNLKEGDLLLLMAVERYDKANVDIARAIIEFLK